MTSDEFNSQYKILKEMAVKEGRSYTAEHLPSHRAVLVHILEENELGQVEALIEQLPPRDRARVLGTMTVAHSLVVVTQFLQGFEGFQAWLRARTSEPAAPSGTPPEPPAGLHGEFTRLFRSADDVSAEPVERSPLSADESPRATPPIGSKFTDLFRAPAAPSLPAAEPGSASIPPVRMVGVRLPLPSDSPSAEPPPPRLSPNFEPTTSPPPAPQPPRQSPNLETSASPPAAPAPPPLSPNFGTSARPASEPSLAGWPRPDEVIIRAGEPPVPPVPPPSWEGPSEFTRQFASVQPTGELAQATDVAEVREEPPERKRSYLPLFLVLNLVFILATGLVVYFALRRC